MIEAVIFDLFGTLVEIQNRQNPYKQLLRLGTQQGRVASPADMRWIMTQAGGIREAGDGLGIKLTAAQLSELQEALDRELESIRPFDDALPAIELLRERKIKVAICSNLAGPYCSLARVRFPNLEGYALSAELGVMKPDPAIYRSACAMIGVVPGTAFETDAARVLMIGDSKKCDEVGPRSCGIFGHHLDRKGAGGFANLLSFSRAITNQ